MTQTNQALLALNSNQNLTTPVADGYKVNGFMVTVATDVDSDGSVVLANSRVGNSLHRALIFGALIEAARLLRHEDAAQRKLGKAYLAEMREIASRDDFENKQQIISFLLHVQNKKIGLNELVLQANKDFAANDINDANQLNINLDHFAAHMIAQSRDGVTHILLGIRDANDPGRAKAKEFFTTTTQTNASDTDSEQAIAYLLMQTPYTNHGKFDQASKPVVYLHKANNHTSVVLTESILAAMAEERKARSTFVDPEKLPYTPVEKITAFTSSISNTKLLVQRRSRLWNPFEHLVDTNNYKSSRLLNSSILKRFFDTFTVFYGSIVDDDFKLSLLDILILPVIFRLLAYRYDRKSYLINFFNALFSTIKLVLATALTIAVTPIVLLVDLGFKIYNYFSLKIVDKISAKKVVAEQSGYKNTMDEGASTDLQVAVKQELVSHEQPLGDIVKKCQKKLAKNEKLVIKPFYQTEGDNHSPYYDWGYTAEANENKSSSTNTIALALCVETHPHHDSSRVAAIIEITPENAAGVKLLLKHNLFHTTHKLEVSHTLAAIETKCGLRK